MKLRNAYLILLFPTTVSAATMPSWVNPLPYGELICETNESNGLKWYEDLGTYVHTKYNPRVFIIQRLDTADPKYTKHNCKSEDSSNYNEYDDSYTRSACYRYNNAEIGWTQGWCKETYMRTGPIYVTCDNNGVFEPRIGFSPSRYFYSYGRSQSFTLLKPSNAEIYMESGRCNTFSTGYKNKRPGAYYSPED